MFVVTVAFEVKPENSAEFRVAVLAQALNSLTREPACQRFDVCFDPHSPERVFLYELYDDRVAFDAHTQTEHFAQFSNTVEHWVIGKEVNLWTLDAPSQKPR